MAAGPVHTNRVEWLFFLSFPYPDRLQYQDLESYLFSASRMPAYGIMLRVFRQRGERRGRMCERALGCVRTGLGGYPIRTVGYGPVHQGVGGLVQDSVRSDSGAGVQHHVQSSNQQPWRGNKTAETFVRTCTESLDTKTITQQVKRLREHRRTRG